MSTPTFTRHEHGAWCHPAADGCPSEIPAPGLSPAEAARVAEFDAAPEPPEIAVINRVRDIVGRLNALSVASGPAGQVAYAHAAVMVDAALKEPVR